MVCSRNIILVLIVVVWTHVSCTRKTSDYWASSDSETESQDETTTDLDTGTVDDDTGEKDDAGMCLPTDAGATCGDTDTSDGTDSPTDSDTEDWDGGVGGFEKFCGNPKYAPFTQMGENVFSEGGPYRGNPATAEIVVHGFSHFYCSHCRDASDLIDEMFAESYYPKHVVYYFHHYYWYSDTSLTEWAPHKAAHAAHLQGQFWSMHDAIFDDFGVERDDLFTIADTLGLDPGTFSDDFDSNETAAYLRAEYGQGQDAGVTGTPTVFLNGRRVPSWTELRELIDCLLGRETDY